MALPNAPMANDNTREKEQPTPGPTAPSTADDKKKDKDETKDNRKGGYGAG